MKYVNYRQLHSSKNQSYDYHRHAGKQQQGWPHLLKDEVDIFFWVFSNLYDTNIADYFVSNFVANTNQKLGHIIKSGDENYKSWSRRIESLHYYYEQDIEYILSMITDKLSFDDLFTAKIGQHPPIVKYLFYLKINIETLIILDDILRSQKD